MKALVLGGGGARGALQVGALRALVEAELQPDLLVGTSIGALNATYLCLHGCSHAGLDSLEEAWQDAAEADLLPDNYLWLTLRALVRRRDPGVEERIRDFFVGHGLSPDLRFGQLPGPRLVLVAADLAAGRPVLYGNNPDGSVLQAVLASTAIPPWVQPQTVDGQLLIDGGLVSNLPIEPALAEGAKEIVALDLVDPRPPKLAEHGPGAFVFQMLNTMERRQIELECALAEARGVPLHDVKLRAGSPIAVWEFSRSPALVQPGYEIMQRYLEQHPELGHAQAGLPWWQRLLQRRDR